VNHAVAVDLECTPVVGLAPAAEGFLVEGGVETILHCGGRRGDAEAAQMNFRQPAYPVTIATTGTSSRRTIVAMAKTEKYAG
jgi:hypothetical protein